MILYIFSLFLIASRWADGQGKMMWESGMMYEKSYWKGLKHNYDNMTTKRYEYQGECVLTWNGARL